MNKQQREECDRLDSYIILSKIIIYKEGSHREIVENREGDTSFELFNN
jgi:hypothetical protein